MNNYSSDIIIKAPVNTLQDIINSRCIAEESVIKYCEEKDSSCIIRDYWPPIIDPIESELTFMLYSRGMIPLTLFDQIVRLYPNSTIDVKVSSMGTHWYHYTFTEKGAYKVYNEEDLRNDIIDTQNLLAGEDMLDYEIAYRFMLSETCSWCKRLDVDDAIKEFVDVIPFPEDLVPERFKTAWNNDKDSFRKYIRTLMESWYSLKKLSEPESISQSSTTFVDDDECPF